MTVHVIFYHSPGFNPLKLFARTFQHAQIAFVINNELSVHNFNGYKFVETKKIMNYPHAVISFENKDHIFLNLPRTYKTKHKKLNTLLSLFTYKYLNCASAIGKAFGIKAKTPEQLYRKLLCLSHAS